MQIIRPRSSRCMMSNNRRTSSIDSAGRYKVGGSMRIIRRRATYTGSAATWSKCVCDTSQVGVPIKSHGCAPRSNPILSSGMRQYVCTAARE